MGQLQEFLNILEEQVKNHSIYIWGAQGQCYPTVTEAWIKSKESGTHEKNALKTYRAAVEAGYKMKLRAFDCSGLGIWALQQLGIIKTDMTANGLKGKCTSISKSELQKGDWVFRVSSGKAYHIGYVVDDKLNVIEAKGRAYGVVKNSLNGYGTNYWNAFGRPTYFASEIKTKPPEKCNVTRLLKYVKPYMKGEDVEWLQKALNYAGYSCGSIDGIFGKNTMNALKKYQKAKKLIVSGEADGKTVVALGGTWKSNAPVNPNKEEKPVIRWVVSRNLKKGCKGEDVKALQDALIKAGFSCGAKGIDGDFGINTYSAVRAYQKSKGLTVDGVAGKKTVTALGGTWQ